MHFDFERFTRTVCRVYQSNEAAPYSIDDVLSVFQYYFSAYERYTCRIHPYIKTRQIQSIIEKMPFLPENGEISSGIDISPEEYEAMIDQHFVTNYKRCDYNINHFFSGRIRNLRYYETCY